MTPLQDGVGVLPVRTRVGQAPERTEVYVERQVRLAADLGRHLQDADAPAGEAANLGVALDAAHRSCWLTGGTVAAMSTQSGL